MKRQVSLEATSSSQSAIGARRKSLEDAPVVGKFRASSFGQMLDLVKAEAQLHQLWNEEMHRDLPKKWEKHGDLVILPHNCFQHPNWRMFGRRLWQMVAEALQTERLGRKRRIADDDIRSPHIDLLYGAHGWVEHIDNGVRFQYDVTKCMFSIQNASEKARIAEFNCHHETVVDLFAGIGYYTLPYLINAGAKHIIAIDWNADAIEALNRNIEANGVADRCTVIEGDCRRVCPHGVADRVNMGLLPTAKQHWLTGCKALKATGGIIHAHDTLPTASAPSKKGATEPDRVKRRERLVQQQNSSLGSVSEDSEIVDLPSQSSKVTVTPKINGKIEKQVITTPAKSTKDLKIPAKNASITKTTNGTPKVNGEHKAETKVVSKTTKAINGENKVETKAVSKKAKAINGEHKRSDSTVIAEMVANLADQVSREGEDKRRDSTVIAEVLANLAERVSRESPEPSAPCDEKITAHEQPLISSVVDDSTTSRSEIDKKSDAIATIEKSEQPAAEPGTEVSLTADTASKADSAASCETGETSQEPQENGEKKRKFSRSASIVEEFESLLIPNPKIEKTFRKEKWDSLDQSWRDLCIECATSCCKYLNNIHFEKGKVWTCTVLRIGKVKPYSADIDHVVMDIDCRPVSEKIAFSDEDIV